MPMPIIISPPPLLLLLHRLSCFFLLLLCLPPSTALDRSTWIQVQRMHRPTASFLLQVVNRHNGMVRTAVTLDRANEHCEFVLSQNYAWDLQQDRQLWLRLSWGEGENESVFINPIQTDTALEAQGKTYVFRIYTTHAMVTVFDRGDGAQIGDDRVADRFNPQIPSDDIRTLVEVRRKGNRNVIAGISNNDIHLENVTLNEANPSHIFFLSKDALDLKERQKVRLHLTEGEGWSMQKVSINPIYTDNETTAEGRTYIFGVSRNRISLVVFQRRKGAGDQKIIEVHSVREWGEDDLTFVSVRMNTATPVKVALLNADNTTTEIDTLHRSGFLSTTFRLSHDAEDLRRRQPVWLLVTRRAMDTGATAIKLDPIGGDNEFTAEGKTYIFDVYEYRVALAVYKHKHPPNYTYHLIRSVRNIRAV